MEKTEEMVARIMRGLRCTEEEAREIYKSDCAVDKGEKQEFDLTQAQLKVARQFAHTGTRKTTAYKFTKRERKPNATKGGIIAELASFLSENSEFSVENVNITNKERQIAFTIGENSFELTLVQKRAPKNK